MMVTERFLRSFDGTELFISESGAGLPLVLCDGLGCAGFVWRQLKPAFEDRYRLVHWHYRGHGNSQPPHNPGAMSVADLCGDLLAVLESLAPDQAVLLGHSMGVQVILEFAVRHPERVLGLVPMCGSYGRPLWTLHDDHRAAEIFPILKTLAERFPRLAQKIWKNLLTSELAYQYGVHVELNPLLVKREDFAPYFESLAAIDVQLFMRLLEDLNRHTVEDRLHLIKTPTLVVGGEQDKFTPAWLSRRMAELIPGAELLMVPSGTHAAPIELPELVHLRLERFLNEHVHPVANAEPAGGEFPAPKAKKPPIGKQSAKKKVSKKAGKRAKKPKSAGAALPKSRKTTSAKSPAGTRRKNTRRASAGR